MNPSTTGLAAHWYDIGIQLMENSAGVLQTIKANHQSDVNASCTAMFEKWLKMNPDASWNQLVSALKNIDDMSLAIENLKEQNYQKVARLKTSSIFNLLCNNANQ